MFLYVFPGIFFRSSCVPSNIYFPCVGALFVSTSCLSNRFLIISPTSLPLQEYLGKASDKAHRNCTRRWTLRHLIADNLAGRRFTGSGDCQMLAQHTEGELQRFPQDHLLRWLVEQDISFSNVHFYFYRGEKNAITVRSIQLSGMLKNYTKISFRVDFFLFFRFHHSVNSPLSFSIFFPHFIRL